MLQTEGKPEPTQLLKEHPNLQALHVEAGPGECRRWCQAACFAALHQPQGVTISCKGICSIIKGLFKVSSKLGPSQSEASTQKLFRTVLWACTGKSWDSLSLGNVSTCLIRPPREEEPWAALSSPCPRIFIEWVELEGTLKIF